MIIFMVVCFVKFYLILMIEVLSEIKMQYFDI